MGLIIKGPPSQGFSHHFPYDTQTLPNHLGRLCPPGGVVRRPFRCFRVGAEFRKIGRSIVFLEDTLDPENQLFMNEVLEILSYKLPVYERNPSM